MIPCGDAEDIHISGEKHQSVHAAGECHDQHDHETCSPFCVCACCGVQTTVPAMIQFALNADQNAFQHIPFGISEIAEVYYPIWQPPKVA